MRSSSTLRNVLRATYRIASLTFTMIAIFYTGAIAQSGTSPVGCFRDLHEVQGDMFGFGVIKIWKHNGGYAGSFSERRSELGEHYKATRLRNIRYDRRTRLLRFDISFNASFPSTRRVSATVSKHGITVNVGRKMRSEYGGPNPLFQRKLKDCY